MAGKGRAQGGGSGGYRPNAGRKHGSPPKPQLDGPPDGVDRPGDAVGYLTAVMCDKGVSAARRDAAAKSLLGAVARQGGVGKRELTALAAKHAMIDPTSPWFDETLGVNLLGVQDRWRKQKAEKQAREPATDSQWGDDLRYRGYKYPPPPDDE
jgi:hypothetical protein